MKFSFVWNLSGYIYKKILWLNNRLASALVVLYIYKSETINKSVLFYLQLIKEFHIQLKNVLLLVSNILRLEFQQIIWIVNCILKKTFVAFTIEEIFNKRLVRVTIKHLNSLNSL